MTAQDAATPRSCRFCGTPLRVTFMDLGSMPLANDYLAAEEAVGQPAYPLHARVCERCLLVQVDDVVPPEAIFGDYSYFSSYSASWVEHARVYCEQATSRLGLDSGSLVVEVASNDGYLLQHLVRAGIPVLGVEPAANVAGVARERGIRTETAFFGAATAERLRAEHGPATLMVANNVIAHVPDLNDFVEGFAILLADDGVVTIECPHLLRLIEHVEFDTIYHEHYSYYSLATLARVLAAHGLEVFDVEELASHGGSLRTWAAPAAAGRERSPAVQRVLDLEAAAGLDRVETYRAFAERADRRADSVRAFLRDAASRGATVLGYGAAAKGGTLLNYCGIDSTLMAAVVDRSPHKQGRVMPGSQIPIVGIEALVERRPDVLFLLVWNLTREVVRDLGDQVHAWGGRFATSVPDAHWVDP